MKKLRARQGNISPESDELATPSTGSVDEGQQDWQSARDSLISDFFDDSESEEAIAGKRHEFFDRLTNVSKSLAEGSRKGLLDLDDIIFQKNVNFDFSFLSYIKSNFFIFR